LIAAGAEPSKEAIKSEVALRISSLLRTSIVWMGSGTKDTQNLRVGKGTTFTVLMRKARRSRPGNYWRKPNLIDRIYGINRME
jgi:hypothetical protein